MTESGLSVNMLWIIYPKNNVKICINFTPNTRKDLGIKVALKMSLSPNENFNMKRYCQLSMVEMGLDILS